MHQNRLLNMNTPPAISETMDSGVYHGLARGSQFGPFPSGPPCGASMLGIFLLLL